MYGTAGAVEPLIIIYLRVVRQFIDIIAGRVIQNCPFTSSSRIYAAVEKNKSCSSGQTTPSAFPSTATAQCPITNNVQYICIIYRGELVPLYLRGCTSPSFPSIQSAYYTHPGRPGRREKMLLVSMVGNWLLSRRKYVEAPGYSKCLSSNKQDHS